MSVKVHTSFHPFRMILSKKEPVQLKVDVENTAETSKKVTMELLLSRELSLDKGGLHSSTFKRIDVLEPRKPQTFYFDLHPKMMTRAGEQPMEVKVLHHYNEYKFVEKEQTFPFSLRVDD